jgi:hypothetical protein
MLALPLTIRAKKLEPLDSISMRMRGVVRTIPSPSPPPSPLGRGRIIASRGANREARELSRDPQSGSSLLLSRAHSVGAHRKEPQRREERRETSGRERAKTHYLSITDSRVTETGPSLRSSRLCGLTGLPSTGWLQLREMAGVRGNGFYAHLRHKIPASREQFGT